MRRRASSARVTILVNNRASQGFATEHGLSIWIEVAGQRLLFDTGQGPALRSNTGKLGIDLRAADSLVLSHGHYDHTGGVPLVIECAPSVQVFVHPAATGPRYSIRDGSARSIAMPGAAKFALERLSHGGVHWITQPQELLANGVGIASHIPRLTDYEDTGDPFFIDSAAAYRDPIADDLALWISTGRGLVVVVGCGHAGLINTLEHAQRLSGEPKLHAVLGGFHLAEASEARLERTVHALKALDPDLIVACHCTGGMAVDKLRQTFGERVELGSAGAVYQFGVVPTPTER